MAQGRTGRVTGDMVDPKVSLEDRKQLVELLVSQLNAALDSIRNMGGDGRKLGAGDPVVLHGDSIPAHFTNAQLHRSLVGDDLHVPRAHRTSHDFTGSDPLTSGMGAAIAAVPVLGAGPGWTPAGHNHEGLHALNSLLGDVSLVAGTNVSIVVGAGTITISATGGLGAADFVDLEVPTGLVDGANKTFVFANPPSPDTSLRVMVVYPGATAAAVLVKGGGFTYDLAGDPTGATITTSDAEALPVGSLIWGFYRK